MTRYLSDKWEEQAYNGYKNYETWNVVLWISNDEGLYEMAKAAGSFETFREELREFGNVETPDRVAWSDSGIDTDVVNETIGELG